MDGPPAMPAGQRGVDIMINRLRKRRAPAGPLLDRWKEIIRRWNSSTERPGVGPDEIRKLNSDLDAAGVKP